MSKPVVIVVALIVVVGLFVWFRDSGDKSAPPLEEPTTPSKSVSPAVSVGMIDDERINNAASEPDLWLAYGRDYYEQRFSPLSAIDRDTVGRLNLAWARDMGTNSALEATPIMVDGTLFFTTSFSVVHAVDAKSGDVIAKLLEHIRAREAAEPSLARAPPMRTDHPQTPNQDRLF
jgi:hypothetical protein